LSGDAREWQSFSRPKSLDYTHGELMCTDDTQWHEFAIKKLQENPTNKRTIIPLITKEDLYITVYMRALEVHYFLSVNICKIYLIAKNIKEGIPTIKKVTVCFLYSE
jgi:hypothetical protein